MRRHVSLYATLVLLIFLLLNGCATLNKPAKTSKDAFPVCYGYGCKKIQQVSLNTEQWSRIDALFSPPAANAHQERQQIALAIAEMERLVGPITDTQNDLPGTFKAFFISKRQQMDCVDEAKNSTTYLKLFQQRGLVRLHRAVHRINRGFFFNGWPHTSAAIQEIKNKQGFAVDSWFHKNGMPPEIIPIKLWYSGWSPPVAE